MEIYHEYRGQGYSKDGICWLAKLDDGKIVELKADNYQDAEREAAGIAGAGQENDQQPQE